MSVCEIITSVMLHFLWVWGMALCYLPAWLNCWLCNALLVCDGAFGECLYQLLSRGSPFSTGSEATCWPETVRWNPVGSLGIFMLLYLHLWKKEIYSVTGKLINFSSSSGKSSKRFLLSYDLSTRAQIFVPDTLNRLKLCVINDFIIWPCARSPYVHLCKHEARQTASAVLLDLSQIYLLQSTWWGRQPQCQPPEVVWCSADVVWWYYNRFNGMRTFLAHFF